MIKKGCVPTKLSIQSTHRSTIRHLINKFQQNEERDGDEDHSDPTAVFLPAAVCGAAVAGVAFLLGPGASLPYSTTLPHDSLDWNGGDLLALFNTPDPDEIVPAPPPPPTGAQLDFENQVRDFVQRFIVYRLKEATKGLDMFFAGLSNCSELKDLDQTAKSFVNQLVSFHPASSSITIEDLCSPAKFKTLSTTSSEGRTADQNFSYLIGMASAKYLDRALRNAGPRMRRILTSHPFNSEAFVKGVKMSLHMFQPGAFFRDVYQEELARLLLPMLSFERSELAALIDQTVEGLKFEGHEPWMRIGEHLMAQKFLNDVCAIPGRKLDLSARLGDPPLLVVLDVDDTLVPTTYWCEGGTVLSIKWAKLTDDLRALQHELKSLFATLHAQRANIVILSLASRGWLLMLDKRLGRIFSSQKLPCFAVCDMFNRMLGSIPGQVVTLQHVVAAKREVIRMLLKNSQSDEVRLISVGDSPHDALAAVDLAGPTVDVRTVDLKKISDRDGFITQLKGLKTRIADQIESF